MSPFGPLLAGAAQQQAPLIIEADGLAAGTATVTAIAAAFRLSVGISAGLSMATGDSQSLVPSIPFSALDSLDRTYIITSKDRPFVLTAKG